MKTKKTEKIMKEETASVTRPSTFRIVAAACLLFTVSSGLRSVYGIMLNTIAAETGIAYASVSFAIAVAQLVFGLAQPIFGIVALKKSNRFVLMFGCILMAAGLSAIPFCSAPWMLVVCLGLLFAVGTGAISFGIIMSAVTPLLGEQRASAVSGMINACSGLGSILFSPLMQNAFARIGFLVTMFCFAGLMLLLLLLIAILFPKSPEEKNRKQAQSDRQIFLKVRHAFHSKDYLFLLFAFFTCGFHMAIIETHLYSQILSYHISESIAAMGFSLYGIAAVCGSLLSGFLCSRFPMKRVGAALFGSRTLWIIGFLLLPKNIPVVFIFLLLLGLTGNSTVPPISGLVSRLYGSEYLATLFGILFIAHQLGSFMSSFFGGLIVTATGSYILSWCISAALSAGAMLACSLVQEPERS